MRILEVCLILVWSSSDSHNHPIEVVDSGLMQLHKQNMALIFYVTVRHQGHIPQRIMATVVECCEKMTDLETDCNVIDLFGGDMGVLQTGAVRNLTLVYPSLYGYNRKGSCLIDIWHRVVGSEQSNEIRHRIDFDTTLQSDEAPDVLKGFYKPDQLIPCETSDLDPMDNCFPVNCNIKYLGRRNYYSTKWKRCQKVPTCVADPAKELPDVAYVPNTNTCRDLDNILTEEDIKLLTTGMIDSKPLDSQPHMVNVRCHHGQLDAKTGLCMCDKGWKSEPFDSDTYNPTTSVYHMCNIKCHTIPPNDTAVYRVLPTLIGAVIALWFSVSILCCEKYGYFYASKKKKDGLNAKEDVMYFPAADCQCNKPSCAPFKVKRNRTPVPSCLLSPS